MLSSCCRASKRFNCGPRDPRAQAGSPRSRARPLDRPARTENDKCRSDGRRLDGQTWRGRRHPAGGVQPRSRLSDRASPPHRGVLPDRRPAPTRLLAEPPRRPHRLPRARGGELVIFVGGKLVFLGLAFGIPLLRHPPLTVLFFYTVTAFLLGLGMVLVFVLPHLVGESEFPQAAGNRLEVPWAVHQVRVTLDFARKSRIWTWLLGGLNFSQGPVDELRQVLPAAEGGPADR